MADKPSRSVHTPCVPMSDQLKAHLNPKDLESNMYFIISHAARNINTPTTKVSHASLNLLRSRCALSTPMPNSSPSCEQCLIMSKLSNYQTNYIKINRYYEQLFPVNRYIYFPIKQYYHMIKQYYQVQAYDQSILSNTCNEYI